ncbi:MAG: hypothetical protein ACJ76N_00530 [Thermoanaerobaculia bacterium]
MNDERLRQILRQGDPAEGDGMTLEEAREMRRTVLTAVPERRRLLPLLALAGAVATAVLLAVLLLRPEPVPAPHRVAAASAPPAPPVAQAPVQPAPAPRPLQERAERRPVHRHHPPYHRRLAVPATPAINDTLASLETADTERQVQFSTPGGTRIIWILKSGKASR